MKPDSQLYRSKVDPWIAIVLLGTIAISILVLFTIPRGAGPTFTIALVSVCGIWLITLPFIWPIAYVLEDSVLIVRIGVIRRRVEVSSIIEIVSQTGLEIKPFFGLKAAYSTDRLLITTDRPGLAGQIAISPVDKRRFMEDLRSRDPSLKFQGEDLRR